MARSLNFIDALNEALHQEMERDERVFIELEDAWHTYDGDAPGSFLGDEERQNQIVRSDRCLTHKCPELWRGAESAESVSDVHIEKTKCRSDASKP